MELRSDFSQALSSILRNRQTLGLKTGYCKLQRVVVQFKIIPTQQMQMPVYCQVAHIGVYQNGSRQVSDETRDYARLHLLFFQSLHQYLGKLAQNAHLLLVAYSWNGLDSLRPRPLFLQAARIMQYYLVF